MKPATIIQQKEIVYYKFITQRKGPSFPFFQSLYACLSGSSLSKQDTDFTVLTPSCESTI